MKEGRLAAVKVALWAVTSVKKMVALLDMQRVDWMASPLAEAMELDSVEPKELRRGFFEADLKGISRVGEMVALSASTMGFAEMAVRMDRYLAGMLGIRWESQ